MPYCSISVVYEARLEDRTLVSKSEGVEFTVKDGMNCIKHIKNAFLPI